MFYIVIITDETHFVTSYLNKTDVQYNIA